MPKTSKSQKTANPLLSGLETGRIYALIGLVQIKVDGKVAHNLAVVHNPYIIQDPRKGGEMWGKAYLNNTKKNKKYIDIITMTYGLEVYQFMADVGNNVFTYDFFDIL